MKRLVVIVALVLSAANIFASDLIIRGNVDIPFSVFINGKKYYSYNNKVTITNLSRGRYAMEIYTEGKSNELLYDYSIDVPWSSTVSATFTGDNKMYISTSNNTPNVVVHLNPYPRRVVAPVYHHYAPAPKPHYHSSLAPKPHHAAPAPKHNSKPSAPNHAKAKPHNGKSSSAATSTYSKPTSRAYTSRSTTNTRR